MKINLNRQCALKNILNLRIKIIKLYTFENIEKNNLIDFLKRLTIIQFNHISEKLNKRIKMSI